MLRPHVADNAVSGWWRTRAIRDFFCIVLLRDMDVEWSNQSAQGILSSPYGPHRDWPGTAPFAPFGMQTAYPSVGSRREPPE